ncbi:NADPH-dependent FMN reductase [Streptomyces marincola]|uniref:NADPH-dependent FMN reductase n=1 Tax=Streptomyces marincola TaxID=2878388 RepID=UPI001CF57A4C|nr:NAD(P)H-dependent oxidoreductase [Streptomyces marincola]UCM87066.1 NAD(P)H-dependent oxidoreductase [Streptomyces marincola]
MTRIAVIVGSTRPRRRTAITADWTLEVAQRHPEVKSGRASVELLDLVDFELPVLDEPVSPAFGHYEYEHSKRWAQAVASYDAYIFVTPEYNHSFPGALKNAIDFLYQEWAHKAAGFVSHGVTGGTRAVEHLRTVMSELKVATVSSQVALNAFTDFEITDPTLPGTITPGPYQEQSLNDLLDDLIPWAEALKQVRLAKEAAS